MRRPDMVFLSKAVSFAAIALVVMPVLSASIGPARGADTPPWKTMRALLGLEDRIANGDAIAQAARSKVVARLAATFTAMPAETWRDTRNARALIAYLFSGGDAAAIDRSIAVEALNKDTQNLYRGALAYGFGDDESARSLLLPIEAKSLPTGLAGHLALVQAALLEPTDKAKAMTLYDLVRLIEPGTLVEESALRRQMTIAGATKDYDKLAFLERRYQAAFSKSVYVETFRQLVTELAFRAVADNTIVANQSMERILGPCSRDDRRRIYLAAARREAVAGRVISATYTANEGLKLSEKGGRDEARGRIYWGAISIVGEGYDKAAQTLLAISPDRLDDRDRNLRSAALEMAATMRAATLGAGTQDPKTTTNTLSRGMQALDGADSAIRGVKP